MSSFDVHGAWEKGTDEIIQLENGEKMPIKVGIIAVIDRATKYEKDIAEKKLGKAVEQKSTEERS